MLPLETLSELLKYLAEHEEFRSLSELGSISPDEVRVALRDLSNYLRQKADKERTTAKIDPKHFEELTPKVKQVLSTLTPREFQILFKQFGIEA